MSKIKIFGLGGLNENGKNMYIVEVDKDIFVFDAGLKHADDKMLGVDYIIPNYDYIKKNIKNVQGIFITHGHDNQKGALTEIVKEIPNVKIYGTKFTLEVIKDEFIDENLDTSNLIIDVHCSNNEPKSVISFLLNLVKYTSFKHLQSLKRPLKDFI